MKNWICVLGFIILFLVINQSLKAQKNPYEGLLEAVWLDSMTITAKKSGFNVENFIDLVRNDTSFYQAFKNLRLISHQASHSQEFFTDKGKRIDFYNAKTYLRNAGNCKEIQYVFKEKSSGYQKRNGESKYITAKLYEKVFLPNGKLCPKQNDTPKKEGIIDYYYGELKQFIFQPGEKANVPFIGNKTALFSEKMKTFYHYGIESKNYIDGTPCYVFTIRVKDEYLERKTNKTIIKFMETYFSRKNFQVMGRKYEVQYPGPIFSFQINVNVSLFQMDNKEYLPSLVAYKGRWDIPGRKEEIGQFKMEIIQ